MNEHVFQENIEDIIKEKIEYIKNINNANTEDEVNDLLNKFDNYLKDRFSEKFKDKIPFEVSDEVSFGEFKILENLKQAINQAVDLDNAVFTKITSLNKSSGKQSSGGKSRKSLKNKFRKRKSYSKRIMKKSNAW